MLLKLSKGTLTEEIIDPEQLKIEIDEKNLELFPLRKKISVSMYTAYNQNVPVSRMYSSTAK